MLRLWVASIVAVAGLACRHEDKAKPVIEDAATGIDPADLAARLDKRCVTGDLEACRELGVMYQEGTGVSPDPRRAAVLFGQACNGSNFSACNNLGLVLAEGIGVDKSPAHAIEVYQKACDGKFMLACRNLGLLLRDGRGVPADLPRAEALLDKACKGSVPFACKNAGDLDAMLAAKAGMPRWKQAVAHYKLGCDSGDPTACRQIGIVYLEGKGLPKSNSAAAVWLERACLPDDGVACRLLGGMVIQGLGVPRDLERGKQLLQRACDAKDDEGCRLVASLRAGAAEDGGVPAMVAPVFDGSVGGTSSDRL